MAHEIENTVKEILDDLIPAMEVVEAQSMAVLRFLKENGIATEEQLEPYLQQGADTSNVKWRAVRVRLEHLLTSAMGRIQEASEKKPQEAEPPVAEDKKPEQETTEAAKPTDQVAATEEKKESSPAAPENSTPVDGDTAERPAENKATSDETEKKEAA